MSTWSMRNKKLEVLRETFDKKYKVAIRCKETNQIILLQNNTLHRVTDPQLSETIVGTFER